jgi:pyruvate/2-oxoglutarate dehydrogenase complex dihydrolipoamide dehydrogenase (E3) component
MQMGALCIGQELMKTHDAIVIGSGQGSVPLATNLADQGWSVALIEKGDAGGSCINYGCTPTKTMISSARIAHYARIAPEFGIHPVKIKVNEVALRGISSRARALL